MKEQGQTAKRTKPSVKQRRVNVWGQYSLWQVGPLTWWIGVESETTTTRWFVTHASILKQLLESDIRSISTNRKPPNQRTTSLHVFLSLRCFGVCCSLSAADWFSKTNRASFFPSRNLAGFSDAFADILWLDCVIFYVVSSLHGIIFYWWKEAWIRLNIKYHWNIKLNSFVFVIIII